MPFQPDDIARKQFLVRARGYDREEVAAFLRAVAADYEEALGAADVEAAEPAPQAQEPDEIKNHGGDFLPDDADFFVDPPEEIGPVLSAYSTLRQGKKPWPLWLRVALGLFLSGVGAGIG